MEARVESPSESYQSICSSQGHRCPDLCHHRWSENLGSNPMLPISNSVALGGFPDYSEL